MERLYFDLVVDGRRTCNPENHKVKQVPENLRSKVLALLEADGRDADGKKIL